MATNIALRELDCRDNRLDPNALNALFRSLHNNTIRGKNVNVANNVNTGQSQPSIAIDRGWTVLPEGIVQAEKDRNAATKWESLRNSNDILVIRNFINRHPNTPSATDAQRRIDEMSRRRDVQSPTKIFIGYTGDTRSALGITFGRLNEQNIGWYFSTRVTPRIFGLLGEVYRIDNAGIVTDRDGGMLDNITLDNYSYIININSVFGITHQIAYPWWPSWLWFYAGGGVSWDSQITSFEQNGNTHRARNAEQSQFGLALDGGLSAKIDSGFMISGGIRTHSFNNAFFTFGIQYSW
jgi:hypothetical protein